MKQSTEMWLKAADDDLMANQSILHRGELTNIIAFHAQQTIEKSLKAVLEEFDIIIIRTHNLETLSLKIQNFVTLHFNQQILAELDKLYLDSRYPGDFGLLPSGKPTQSEANDYYEEASRMRMEIGKILSGK